MNIRLKTISILIPLFCSTITFALNLSQAYQLALRHDPTYLKAQATFQATAQDPTIARSKLLPSLTLNADANQGQNLYDTAIPNISQRNLNYSLILNQTLLNFPYWLSLLQAYDNFRAAEAFQEMAKQDLIYRVTLIYLNILQAHEQLTLANDKKHMAAFSLHQTRLFYQAGLKKSADIDIAKANYDASLNEVITAKQNLINKKIVLQSIIGKHVKHLQPFKLSIRTSYAVKQSPVHYAKYHNPNVVGNRYLALIAKRNISQQQAQHLPTLNAIAGYNYNFAKGSLLNTTSHGDSVALSFNLPLYEGGRVMAQTTQAKYYYLAALFNFQIVWQQTVQQIHQAINDNMKNKQKLRVDRQAISSNQHALNSTRQAYKAGIQSIWSVIQAEQILYFIKQNFINDKYAYRISQLRLLQAMGNLSKLKCTYHAHCCDCSV